MKADVQHLNFNVRGSGSRRNGAEHGATKIGRQICSIYPVLMVFVSPFRPQLRLYLSDLHKI
jgi:hypothetical protein